MWHFVYVHLCPPSPFETGGYLLRGQERTIKNLATDRWMDCLPSSVPQSNVAKRGLLRLERGDLVVKHCPKHLLIPIPLKLLCAHSEWGLEKWRTDRNAWGNSLGLSFESISDWDCHHILLFHKSRSVWLWNHLMGHLKERIPSSFYHPLQVIYCTKREFKKVYRIDAWKRISFFHHRGSEVLFCDEKWFCGKLPNLCMSLALPHYLHLNPCEITKEFKGTKWKSLSHKWTDCTNMK